MKKIESKTERIINKYKMKPKGNYRKIIMGGDEVGRGPLAGPVTVCVASIFKDSERDILKSLEKLAGRPYPIGKDSKKMTEKERVFWFKYLKVLQKEGSINFFINSKSAIEVDKKGIVVCINLILDEMVGKCLIFYKKLWS